MKDDVIHLMAHDSTWSEQAAAEAKIIRDLLPHSPFIVEHIGITAVPGIHAKPIIDLMIGISNLKDGEEFVRPLESIGYSFWRDNPKKDRFYFVKGLRQFGGKGRTHHIHLVERTSEFWQDHVSFRNYLRANSDAAGDYQKLKSDLANRFREDREAYTDAKSEFIQRILELVGKNKALTASPILETKRLVLEPITALHAQELVELFSDPKLHEFVPFEPPTLEEQTKRCARWEVGKSPDGSEIWLNWAARHKESGEIIGHFQSGVKQDHTASVGYVVARPYQGQGLALEAMEAVLNCLRDKYAVKTAKAWSDTRNKASHRLADRLGMKIIEILKDADFFKGSSSDEFIFAKELI